jgi:hypothetical protein
MYEIQRMNTRQRHEQQTAAYRELIGIAEEVVEGARTALKGTRKMRGKDPMSTPIMTAIAICRCSDSRSRPPRRALCNWCRLSIV